MGTNDDTLSLVRAYFRGWTNVNFDEAIGLLAPDLEVEVPINDYTTMESFAKAVVAFGGPTRSASMRIRSSTFSDRIREAETA